MSLTLCLQDINQINTHADEMDLFTMVSRRFKKVFSKQEQMRTFPVYDASIEVSQMYALVRVVGSCKGVGCATRVEGPVKINICCWIRKGSNILGEGFWWFLSWVRYILKFSPVRQCESKSYLIGEFDVIRQWLSCWIQYIDLTECYKEAFFWKRSNAERNILFQADAVESIRPEVVPLW